MKQIIFLIVFLMAACIGMSQGLVVESFNLDPFDATATSRENEVLDFNRIPCALLKVMIIDNTVNFKSDYIVRYNPRGKNEYWIYMSEGARSLIVRSDNFLPQEVVFAKYAPEIKELKRGRTYVLTLSCRGESEDDRVAVTFVCNSPTAEFVIDNYQTERGIRTFRMEPGDHTVKVTAEGYQKLTTTIRVSPYMKKQEISLDLLTDKDIYKILNEGDILLREKKYTQAFKKYLLAAEQGNSYGQNNLGLMYKNGYGVESDYIEAVKWYRRAAEQGNLYGQYNLGLMYQYGYGVEMDCKKALYWYGKAAEQGNWGAVIAKSELEKTCK